MLANILLSIVSICTIISYLPQIIKSIRTKQTADISVGSWLLFFVSSLCYTIYAFTCTNEVMLIIQSCLEMGLNIAILLLAIIYRNNKPQKEEKENTHH